MASSGYSLKDELFNSDSISVLTQAIDGVYDDFDSNGFYEAVMAALPPLELKERISMIREKIYDFIPLEYEAVLKLLSASLEGQEEGQFVQASYSDYVAAYGCTEERLHLSLEYLGEYTKWFSAEFSIRAFINQYPEETLLQLSEWSLSDNEHQRRLASEGLRPKLPWAESIKISIAEGAAPLENLYYDEVRTVTRSVANHLNDISKVEPAYVIERLKSWKSSEKQEPKEMAYIISHSLRTLVKKGHPEALELLGYKQHPDIHVSKIQADNTQLKLGDTLRFEFDIETNEATELMIDYIVDYPKANGKRATKVFKLKKLKGEAGQTYHIAKNHAFQAMTTKKLYSGDYAITLQINGQSYESIKFFLMVS